MISYIIITRVAAFPCVIDFLFPGLNPTIAGSFFFFFLIIKAQGTIPPRTVDPGFLIFFFLIPIYLSLGAIIAQVETASHLLKISNMDYIKPAPHNYTPYGKQRTCKQRPFFYGSSIID